MNGDDYYSILQIDAAATMDEVRAAYKRLALLHHPDRSKHPWANERMQRINAAYEILIDIDKRARYDLERAAPTIQEPYETTSTQPEYDQQTEAGPEDFPEQTPVETQPNHVGQTGLDPEKQEEQRRKRERWLWNQLILILRLILITVILFISSLVNGQVNFMIVLLLISLAIYVTAAMILKVRDLSR